MKARGYIRVSHKEQVDGHSLEAQRASIETLCQQRGWTLERIYVDAGRSAKKDSCRPAFEQMLADARAGQFEVLVVDKIDRFYRHLRGCLTSLDVLNSSHVLFVAVKEQLDFTTPWGKLALTLLGMLAEIFIDNLRQETHKGKYQRAREGLLNGNLPLGYCNGLCRQCTDLNGPGYCPHVDEPNRGNGKVSVRHPIDSGVIIMIYETYAQGTYTDSDVAHRINAATFSGPGGQPMHYRPRGKSRELAQPFSKDTIRDILQRVSYTGKVTFRGQDADGHLDRSRPLEEFAGLHPKLISPELYARCKAVRKTLGHKPRQRDGRPSFSYPLSGLLRCGQCGGSMRGTSADGRRYYVCANGRKLKGACPQKPVLAEAQEKALLDVIAHLPFPEDCEAAAMAEVFSPAEAEARRAAEQLWVQRRARALELYLAGQIDKERLGLEQAECLRQISLLHPSEVSAILVSVQTARTLPTQWAGASDLNKRELLRSVVSAVRLHTQGLRLESVMLAAPLYVVLHRKSGPDEHRVPRYTLLRPGTLPKEALLLIEHGLSMP
jgi:site-specific DNA recombinase